MNNKTSGISLWSKFPYECNPQLYNAIDKLRSENKERAEENIQM